MIAHALAVWLVWTNPSVNADTASVCQPGTNPLTDLARVYVHAQARWSRRDSLLAVVPALGREGQPDSIWFAPGAQTWVVWLVTEDRAGNRSCHSEHLGVNLPLAVEPKAWERETWYDVTGRRLERAPVHSGVYFRRRGASRRTVVILR